MTLDMEKPPAEGPGATNEDTQTLPRSIADVTSGRKPYAAAYEWLHAFYGDTPAGVIWIGGDADGFVGRTFTSTDQAARYAMTLDARGGKGVYHRAYTTTHELADGRGRAEHSAYFYGLGADLDIAGPGHKGKNYPPDEDSIRLVLREAELPEPTLWLFTGGGLNAYWLLPESIELDDESRKVAAKLSADLHAKLIATATGLGWKLDNTSDLARVLRVAGTTNRKVPGASVTVVAR